MRGIPWHISPVADEKQCLEIRYCSMAEKATVSKYDFLNANHQKWILSSLYNGEYRIWNKDTGKYLKQCTTLRQESILWCRLLGEQLIRRNVGKWKTVGKRQDKKSFFALESALSEALKVYDQMGQF